MHSVNSLAWYLTHLLTVEDQVSTIDTALNLNSQQSLRMWDFPEGFVLACVMDSFIIGEDFCLIQRI